MEKYEGDKAQKRKKLLLILIPLIVFVVAFVVGVAFAALRKKNVEEDEGIKVKVESAVKVSASVYGRSYRNNVLIEAIGPIVFDGKQSQDEEKSLDFSKTINITDIDETANYIITITNTTEQIEKTDLIIKASCDIPQYDNLVLKVYYSANGTDFEELTETYLVVEKSDSVRIKFELSITERTIDYSVDGDINIELFSEDNLPEGFETKN